MTVSVSSLVGMNFSAHVYQNIIVNDGLMIHRARKLTVIGPGTREVPTTNVSLGQSNQSGSKSVPLNILSESMLENGFRVIHVFHYASRQPETYIAQQGPT
jgi:hypothetical protein